MTPTWQTDDGLFSPFPYFGGKRKVAKEVWRRFGDVQNYVEPFCGSCAVLLLRPSAPKTETVNDADGLLSNFWRALKYAPDATAEFADWPVNENDLHARHAWLVGQKDSLQSKLEGDPEFYDARIAGWWVWGIACWIGSGWCSGKGPWQVQEIDGIRQLVHVGSAGQGVNRKRERLTGFSETGVNAIGIWKAGPQLNNNSISIQRKRPVINGGAGGNASLPSNPDLMDYFRTLSERLRRVRVCCGDWQRVCGPSVTFGHGMTGVFLDPPYADTAKRASNLYRVDCEQVAHAVKEWAIEQGKNSLMRIALCGYSDEHVMPENWECFSWKQGDGYGGQAKERSNNGAKERIWFSPACSKPSGDLFDKRTP